jgi:hypothetical protein
MTSIKASSTADIAASRRPPSLSQLDAQRAKQTGQASGAASQPAKSDKVQISSDAKARLDRESARPAEGGKPVDKAASAESKPVDRAALRDEMVQALKSGDIGAARRKFNELNGREDAGSGSGGSAGKATSAGSKPADKTAAESKPVDKAALRDEMVQALKSGDVGAARRKFNELHGREDTGPDERQKQQAAKAYKA